MASLLLPEAIRDCARSLYAFCRVADDAVDKAVDSRRAVDELLERLDRIYLGSPADHPADRAFADIVHRFVMPRALPQALIEGFAWDADGRHYESLSDVTAYAVRVAGTVGAMMSVLMGAREDAAIARATDLGIAMQFTNIARDVGEDARNGRLYLPRQWMRDEGLDADRWLERPQASPALARVIARLLDEADRLYQRASTGIVLLPRGCRPAMHAARLLYAEIGREVERSGYDSVSRRAGVATRRKLELMAQAVGAAVSAKPLDASPPLAEAAFLVDAVADAPHPGRMPESFDEKAAWVVKLFLKLENQRT